MTFWCFGTSLAKQKFKIVQIGEIVNLSKTKALNWDMRDLSVVICENIEKTYFNLTCATVIIFVWRTISDNVLRFITYFSSGVNNQPVPIYQSRPLYLFLFEDKMFSLSLSLSLSRDTFRVKKAVKLFTFSIKISDIERSPTTIHDQP